MRKLNIPIQSLVIITLSYFSLSCSKTEDSAMTFKVRGASTVLVPATTTTCKEDAVPTTPATRSIGTKYFQFYFPEIEFDATKIDTAATINIIAITITVESNYINGGKFKCLIAGDELKYLYYGTGEYWDPTSITYDATTSQFKSTNYWTGTRSLKSCALKCGGVGAKDAAFVAPVNFEVLAVSTVKKADGTQVDTPYKASTTGTLRSLF